MANASGAGAIEPLVLVHGGAGSIPDSRDQGKHDGCRAAVRAGFARLTTGGSSMDAVEAAVRSMELDEYFNAGYGSVLDLNGDVRMDVSVMDGRHLQAGAATLIRDIRQPITLARRIMERTPHTYLGADGAMAFARANDIQVLEPPGQLVTEYAREALRQFRQTNGDFGTVEIGRRDIGEVGTVGAVAIDAQGNVACATSTGGMTGKIVGRISDTSVLGAGTYADNWSGAVSTTGNGEAIMRYSLAMRILQRIELLGESAQQATERALQAMTERLSLTAGAITVDRQGRPGIYWTSQKMAWAWMRGDELHYGIRHGDDFVERLNASLTD